MGRERFEAEFGCYSDWLVEACLALDVDPVPAVSRGTGRPALLELASAPLEAGPGRTILDLGCGLGGPGMWLARTSGAEVVGVDVMVQSITGARRLDPALRGVVASLRSLPIREGSFDAAWSLGVLEMVADKLAATKEMFRVLRTGAPLVVYDFVLTSDVAKVLPQADRFSPPDDTLRCLEAVGFKVKHASAVPELPPTPSEWISIRDSVRAEVDKRHGGDTRLTLVYEELQTFRDLVADSSIEEWMFVARKGE